MKKFASLVLIIVLTFTFTGCNGTETTENTIKIGVTPEPHGQIIDFIVDDLKDKGIEIEIVEFTDYVTPNMALTDGDLDANFFQHKDYMNNFKKENNIDIVSIGAVHIEPLGLYSSKYESIDDLEDGSEIIVPNDATNGGRALILLEQAGLITLNKDAGTLATENDIVENPKNLKFTSLEAAQIPRIVEDVDAAIINGNFALSAGLVPAEDSILLEDKDSPYANIIAVRNGEENEEKFAKLLETLQSEKVREFIEENYEGAVIPAF